VNQFEIYVGCSTTETALDHNPDLCSWLAAYERHGWLRERGTELADGVYGEDGERRKQTVHSWKDRHLHMCDTSVTPLQQFILSEFQPQSKYLHGLGTHTFNSFHFFSGSIRPYFKPVFEAPILWSLLPSGKFWFSFQQGTRPPPRLHL
jgi:hypothetical protein